MFSYEHGIGYQQDGPIKKISANVFKQPKKFLVEKCRSTPVRRILSFKAYL